MVIHHGSGVNIPAFPSRMDAVQAPIVSIIGQLIRETPGTISLGQGVVRYGPPPAVRQAVIAALDAPSTAQYHDGHGLPDLLDTLARKLREDNGIDVSRGSRVMVTAGGNMAFVHAVMAVTEPGDEIILPLPFYFNHEMAIQMAGCRAVLVPTDARYQLEMSAIRRAITPRTRAIVTISPNNPSGAVLSEDSLRDVSDLCRERGLYHVSDEAYEYFTYGSARHLSPGSFPGAEAWTISLYSLSKAYGFAGWRVGYLVYPERLAAAMIKSQDTILICPPVVTQVAARAALEIGRSYCRPFLEELSETRGFVLRALEELGSLAAIPPADGAFYVLLKIEDGAVAAAGGPTPLAVVKRLIREHQVAVIPGSAFGLTEGCYLRISYGALEKRTVTEGIGRLVTGLRSIF
jgi:aspartate/methionine/tyrosine aminotransferase